MKYRAYRNLHERNWTIQHKVPGKGWRKLVGVDTFYADRVEFTISEAGRDRARREQRKNVHAFVHFDSWYAPGSLQWDFNGPEMDEENFTYAITYSPYNDRGFTEASRLSASVSGHGRNILAADDCLFMPSGRILVNAYYDAGWSQPKLEEVLGTIHVTV